MAYILIRISDGRLIEAQSSATRGTLMGNALAAGMRRDEVEEREVTLQEMEDAIAVQTASDRSGHEPVRNRLAGVRSLDELKTLLADVLG